MKDSTAEKFDGIKENRENPPPTYFNILYYGLIIWAVIFSAYFLLSGWTSHGEFQEKMQNYHTKHQTTPASGQQ
ncbi:MAG: hypothetical protein KKD63_10895 [Proteobacteria bacterium]|nr:hypothetical protein [Desulfobulbaceae bacterium]MBU4153377.1 hypothetical protein [Pseudomonadota bacterium]MDP2106592.1 cbb3-type cytochrome c oxidase N-terminal domain-containing protein [Desulfobulbaceae bacterium]